MDVSFDTTLASGENLPSAGQLYGVMAQPLDLDIKPALAIEGRVQQAAC